VQGARPVWDDDAAVYCGAPGAPKCMPMPAPKDITPADHLAREFVRRHARIVRKLKIEFGASIDEARNSVSLAPQPSNYLEGGKGPIGQAT
jgi:hypothetical protein